MNPARLLEHFDRISEAPDAVPRLRKFILDLAVRGKLVGQDSNDEPAAELLKRIQAEKARSATGRKSRVSQVSISISDTETPLQLPRGWIWVRVEDVFTSVTDGDHLPPPKTDVGVPLLVIGNIRHKLIDFSGCRHVAASYYSAIDVTRRPRSGDVLYTLVGSYGIPVIVKDDRPFCVQRHIGILRPSEQLGPAFLASVLESRVVFDQATLCATGIAQRTVPLSGLRRILLPLPPLAEQHRIVAKVDELMALCDRLEAAQAERERRRDRVVAASLDRLNRPADNGDASAFREGARFHLAHLPRLTTRPDQIPRLRQAVLNLAVRGKLVPQNPKDEPASTLLRDRRLLLEPDIEPWELPAGWAWSCFEKIGTTIGGGTPTKGTAEYWNGPIPWVSPKDMKVDFIEDAQDHISELAIEESAAKFIPKGSLLMVVRGMILAHSFPTAMTGVRVAINQDMKAIVPFRRELGDFLLLVSKGMKPEVLRLVLRSTHGTCKLLTEDLFSLPLPIPPLAEQGRILVRVNELMALCDRLAAQLTVAQADSRRLLDAVLHEALDPVVESVGLPVSSPLIH